ncbi:hypothetical protein CDL15_Pgr008655 [Punica granatum]|uniref:Uncharacterized protein n=1 Tax=Punica granatum TaxID=22663 RepID=A0A218XCW0_PUNGR|nr:hypothetical protein CDL15_Pgr008655 [Punica granatum]
MLVVTLAANWLTVPSWMTPVGLVEGVPLKMLGGGRCIEGTSEYAGGTPAGVGGDGACVEGG